LVLAVLKHRLILPVLIIVTSIAIMVNQYENYQFFYYLPFIISIWRPCETLRVKQHDAYNTKMCLLMYSFTIYSNIILPSTLKSFKYSPLRFSYYNFESISHLAPDAQSFSSYSISSR
jgi:hypothetical protein